MLQKTLPALCKNVASTLLACCLHVASMLPTHWKNIATMLPAYYQQVARMVLQRGLKNFQSFLSNFLLIDQFLTIFLVSKWKLQLLLGLLFVLCERKRAQVVSRGLKRNICPFHSLHYIVYLYWWGYFALEERSLRDIASSFCVCVQYHKTTETTMTLKESTVYTQSSNRKAKKHKGM